MDWTQLYDVDLLGGFRRYAHLDHAGNLTHETKQDVTEIVDGNRAMYRGHPGGWKGDMHRVARIPLSIYWKLYQEGVIQDDEKFRRWLNDPENAAFRTRPGKV